MKPKTEALPYLRRLAQTMGQPVHLAILSGRDAIYIESVSGDCKIISPDRDEEISRYVMDTADNISKRMEYTEAQKRSISHD